MPPLKRRRPWYNKYGKSVRTGGTPGEHRKTDLCTPCSSTRALRARNCSRKAQRESGGVDRELDTGARARGTATEHYRRLSRNERDLSGSRQRVGGSRR